MKDAENSFSTPVMDRIARHYSRARRALETLMTHGADRNTLHHFRITLRRLEAYFELAGEPQQAQLIAQCVSKLSPLRTLHVFERYLMKEGAPQEDIRAVEQRIDALSEQLAREEVYLNIQRCLDELVLPSLMPSHWMQERLRLTRAAHGEALDTLIRKTSARPRKKSLHALRLRIKAIRYQEEWASEHIASEQDLIHLLKRAQNVLGRYEEQAQFYKLAKRLGLESVKRIRRDCRRARKRARALPPQLLVVVERLLKKASARPRARRRAMRNFSQEQSAG